MLFSITAWDENQNRTYLITEMGIEPFYGGNGNASYVIVTE